MHKEKEHKGRQFIQKHFEFMTVAEKVISKLEEVMA
jgi:hypothetical protein